MKICAGASSGGHMIQLLKLLEHSNMWPKKPDFYLTTKKEAAAKLSKMGPVYIIGDANRNSPIRAFMVFIKCLAIAYKERPDVVITTGSMPLAFFAVWSKIFGSQIIWIDSIANIEEFSMSGKLVRRFADLFLTQWQELAEKDKYAEYAGFIL